MRKRTLWAILALSSAGMAGYGLTSEPSAVAAMQEERTDDAGGAGAAPLTTPPDAGGGEKQDARNEACPTTAAAKVNMVLRELHVINRSEIESGRLAEQRAQAGEVKEYARIMVRDHSEADRKIAEYAKRNGIDLTKVAPIDPIHAALDRADSAEQKALGTKHGADFDAAYVAPQALEHRVALSVAEEGQKYAKDEAKELLDGVHRMLVDHLARAEKLGGQLHFQPAAIGGGPEQEGSSERTDGDGGAAVPQGQGDASPQTTEDAAAPRVRPPPVDGREESGE